jgi:1,4-alpha-glucan branching enzyme
MIQKRLVAEDGVVWVSFELPVGIDADRVSLVGDFNDWDTGATPMAVDRTGVVWKATIQLEAGRRYRFRYLIDGKEWLNDWLADDYAANPYGAYDSVIDLREPVEPPSR